MIEVQQSTKPRSTIDTLARPVVVAGFRWWPDELATQPLVKALSVRVCTELAEQVAKVAFAEDNEVIVRQPS